MPPPHEPTASVVICAYSEERWPLLVDAVRSVRVQSPRPREVVVVIDHDERLLARAAAELDGATVIPNTGPQGLSGARNTGWRATSADVVAFLDDDATAEEGWLAALLDGYRDPDVVGVGGWIRPRWEAPPPGWLPEEFHWVFGCSYRGLPTGPDRVRNLIGANMSFRRAELEAAGGFSAEMGRVGGRMLHCEDTEFCIRATAGRPGAVMLHRPDAVVRHYVPSARTSWRYFRVRCYTEGLAKARIARMVGADRGLSSERRYVTRTLPAGVLRGLRSATGDGLRRAGAIVAGLALTAAGYAVGRARFAIEGRDRG